ncbi:uncharacterized protein [Triticum aestivum]|uniref:uncharacterized protein n=1 Tax=Triticum aestivum TaxID=4565 RepID=UPI001D01C9DB|nr:uncharacterized protein LOC123065380 [Triticum aestivum]
MWQIKDHHAARGDRWQPGYYDATTPANVSWQASLLQAIGNADTTHQIEVARQLQLAHVVQQGASTTINSGEGTSVAGTSEHIEGAFHEQVTNAATNNAESVSEMAIVAAMPTSTPMHTSTSNTQADETATNTEVNDETDDEAQGEEEDGQSEIMIPQPPYLGQRFGTFEDAKEYYQRNAMFHGFAVNTEYHRKIKKLTSIAEVR